MSAIEQKTWGGDWEGWLAEQLIDGDELPDMDAAVAHVRSMSDADFDAALDEYQTIHAEANAMTLEQLLDCQKANPREITREIADRLAQRLGLLDEASGQSEAVYLRRPGGLTVARIACHESGGVSAQLAGHDAPLVDIRLIAAGHALRHDGTSTCAMRLPSSMDDLAALVDEIAVMLGGKS